MDARACMHSYCSALPPSQASSLLMLHVHVQKRPFSRPSIAENKNLALTCAPVSPHGAAGHKNQRRVLVWLFRSPPPPCQVSSRIGYGSCAASTVPLHSWRSCFFWGGITAHDILCGGQSKIGNAVLQEWTENMYKAKFPPGHFTLL